MAADVPTLLYYPADPALLAILKDIATALIIIAVAAVCSVVFQLFDLIMGIDHHGR